MLTFESKNIDVNQAINELIDGDGAVLIKNVYSKKQIDKLLSHVPYISGQSTSDTPSNSDSTSVTEISAIPLQFLSSQGSIS